MKRLLLGMACLGAGTFPTLAQVATGRMMASTDVVAECLFSTYTIALSGYLQIPRQTTNGYQAAQCTGASGILNLNLGDGNHFLNGSRRLSDGVNFIDYALTLGEGARPDLMNTDDVAIVISDATGAGGRQIHGRILAGQGSKPAGVYTDSVILTLTW